MANESSIIDSLHTFLSNEEKNEISDAVLDKLNNHYVQKVELCNNLKIDYEKCKTNYEQQKFLLEKEIVSIQEKYAEESKLLSESKQEKDALKAKSSEQSELVQNLNDKVASLMRQLELCKSEQEATSAQSSAMSVSLESKTNLIGQLKEQVKSLEEHLAKSQKAKCDAVIQAEEASTLQMQFQFKERKFEQEKNLITRQLNILQQQLEERAEEALTLRKENSSSVLALQSEVNHITDEVKILRKEKDSYQKIIDEKTDKVNELLSSLNELRMSEARLEETFRQELAAQKKIASIYEASSDDQNKRSEELEKGIEELRQLLREASEQYGALEKAKAKAEEEAQHSLTQSGQLIKDLQDELNKVNELLNSSMKKDDVMSETFPTASAASELMSKGLTLSQLYTEYVNSCEKLYKAEEENKRLSRYVEQILEEIHEKGPYLKQQREDYERALETINSLHNEIEDSITELEKQKLESEEAKRRSNFLGRENDRLNKQTKDLSKQVSILVTQVEAARAGLPPPSLSMLEDSIVRNSSDVIDQQLVCFRDVAELQEQNRKLLAALREFTDKMESDDNDAIVTKTQQLEEELAEAKKELVELRFSREKMQSIVDNVSSQRDMYRTIVNQQGSMVNGRSRVMSGDDSQVNKTDFGNLKQELESAKKDVEKYKKEYEDYRDERNKNEQLEKNENNRIKTAYEKTKNENIRLVSHAEYNEERLKTLNNNCESYQRQINAIVDKNSTLQTVVGRHESTIENLSQNVLTLTKKLAHAEVLAANLRDERVLLKESEACLIAERDSLHRSQFSQSTLLSNIEAIKNNLDRSDSETKMRYENKIADLTEQCARLKSKIEANTDLKEANHKVVSLEEQLRLSRAEADSVKKSIADYEQQIEQLRSQIQELQDKIPRGGSTPIINRQRIVSPRSSPMQTSPVVSQSVRELQVQLSEERAKLSSVTGAYEQAKTSVENFKKLIEEQEKQLQTSSQNNKSVEEENSNLTRSLEEALKNVEVLREKLRESEDVEKALREANSHQLMKMTEELEKRENELEEAQQRLEDSKKAEEMCKAQMKEQTKLAEDMQDKYEKEVMLHGADLQAMAALKQNLSTFNLQLETLTSAKIKAEEILEETKSGFEIREKELKALNDTLKAREIELEEQNKSILDQFTSLSDKMATIQNKIASGSSSDISNTSFSEDEARSSDQLREVIKYLRREREIAYGKVQVFEAESQRLTAQKKSLEARIDTLDKHLKEERQKNQTACVGAAQYTEIMRKTNTMEALADSNKLLREEKEKLEVNVQTLKTTNESLESNIKPLQESNRQLVGQNEKVSDELKALTDLNDKLTKRTADLVEKLNKSKPEDMIEIQRQLNEAKSQITTMEGEANRLKNMIKQLQRSQQTLIQTKNQVSLLYQNAQAECKKATEDNKKASSDKVRLHQQLAVSMEKAQTLLTKVQQQEDTIGQQKQQLQELRQREELAKKQIESCKQAIEAKDNELKELASQISVLKTKIIEIEKKNGQIRKIATKYKTQCEEAAKSKEERSEEETNILKEKIKELENKNVSVLEEVESLKLQSNQLKETKAKLELEIKKKDELSTTSAGGQEPSQPISNDENVVELTNQLAECQSGRSALESMTKALETERENLLQQIESLNKKLQMQQKILENLQKQSASSSKGACVAMEKPSFESPPTANIKPMAAPVPAASPRCPTPIGSRSIPTASIRPMAPSVVVTTLETHDGAVSSTVTLPQATVTPTPVVPTCTPTQATLTATVSPMTSVVPQTSTLSQEDISGASTSAEGRAASTSTDGRTPTSVVAETSTSDDLVSQALSLVEERGGSGSGQKRKLDETQQEEDDEDEETKRCRLTEEIQEMEEEEAMEGEPSSSSQRNVTEEEEEEIFVLSSDDEESQVPQQSEAEAERVPSSGSVPSSQISHEAPSSRPEPSTSSRQSLAPFAPQYEEDDRTVPSTPTLFVARTCEGAVGVSTPQVPSQGPFEFTLQSSSEASHSNGGLSQIAEGGNIDVTRMDLSQLEQRSPAVEANIEGNISSSAGESESVEQSSAQSEVNEAEAGGVALLEEPSEGVVMEGLSEQVVVSSQVGDNIPEEVDDDDDEEEEEVEEEVEEGEQDQEEEIEEAPEEEEAAPFPNSRVTRGGASITPSTGGAPTRRHIQPIVWTSQQSSGGAVRPRGSPRGRFNLPHQNDQVPRGGGTGRARRTRPNYNRGPPL